MNDFEDKHNFQLLRHFLEFFKSRDMLVLSKIFSQFNSILFIFLLHCIIFVCIYVHIFLKKNNHKLNMNLAVTSDVRSYYMYLKKIKNKK